MSIRPRIACAVDGWRNSASSVLTFAVYAGSPKLVRCPYPKRVAWMSLCVVSLIAGSEVSASPE